MGDIDSMQNTVDGASAALMVASSVPSIHGARRMACAGLVRVARGMMRVMRILVISVIATLVVGCSADKAPPPAPTFSPERFRAHVVFLADDLLEGRDTGSRGHEIAARYVASEFESYGLDPGGVEGSWFRRCRYKRPRVARIVARW